MEPFGIAWVTDLLPLWSQVGGAVREATGYTATYRHTISVDEGGEEGDCLHVRQGYHHTIEGFPNCVVADAIINFFMGRTYKVQQVGFDPRLARRGHLGESVICLCYQLHVEHAIIYIMYSGHEVINCSVAYI